MNRAHAILRRITIAACLATAFLVMASVFTPEKSTASGPHDSSSEPVQRDQVTTAQSTDPHEGLRPLGSFESAQLIVHVFATEAGPRYSVQDRATGTMLATLAAADQVQKLFPAVKFPAVDFSANPDAQHIMTAETTAEAW